MRNDDEQINNQLHYRNKHKNKYQFDELIKSEPSLSKFIITNKYKIETINFSNPDAVKTLNKALLKHYYGLTYWEIPNGYLCPPIPSRAEYIHQIADLIENKNGQKTTILDIGTGANLVYPIIGATEYNWHFIASDINKESILNAEKIAENNQVLKNKIEIRFQNNPKKIFENIINQTDKIDCTICNPPFHASQEEANKSTNRKNKNLNPNITKPVLNFGGKNNELWCEGGEITFIQNMINESINYSYQVTWFTTLVSKETSLKPIYQSLKNIKATSIKTIPFTNGNKTTRIVAWKFN